jgi:hypothetical protein
MDIFTLGSLRIHASLPYFYEGTMVTHSSGKMIFNLTSKTPYYYKNEESKSWGTSEWQYENGEKDQTNFPPILQLKGGRPNVTFKSHADDIHATAACKCHGAGKIF